MEDDEAREMVEKFLKDLKLKGFFILARDGYISLFTAEEGYSLGVFNVG
jgi:hypothetical protein